MIKEKANVTTVAKSVVTIGFAVVVPLVIDALWILIFNNVQVTATVQRVSEAYLFVPYLLLAIEYLTSTLAGFWFLRKVHGWGDTEFRFAYFPIMFLLLFVFRLLATQVLFGRGAI